MSDEADGYVVTNNCEQTVEVNVQGSLEDLDASDRRVVVAVGDTVFHSIGSPRRSVTFVEVFEPEADSGLVVELARSELSRNDDGDLVVELFGSRCP